VALDLRGRLFRIGVPRFIRGFEETRDGVKGRRDRKDRRARRRPEGAPGPRYSPSSAWQELNERQVELGRKLDARKEQFVQTLANFFLKHFDVIGVGTYAPQGDEILNVPSPVRRRLFNYSLLARFRQVLLSKAGTSGKRVIALDEADTSRTCHDCGAQREVMPPTEQTWTCNGCGAVHDRHENAVRNLLWATAEHAAEIVPELMPTGPVEIRRRVDLFLRRRDTRFTGTRV
jgi:putative transposase